MRDGGADDLVGVINAHDILTKQTEENFDLLAMVKSVPMIHDNLPAIAVIDKLRNADTLMLLVFDEYGHFMGVVTPIGPLLF